MKEYFVLLGGNKLLWGQVCKLREFGYKVIVIAWNDHPDITGDLFIQMDVKDKDGIIRKLEELGLKDHVDGALMLQEGYQYAVVDLEVRNNTQNTIYDVPMNCYSYCLIDDEGTEYSSEFSYGTLQPGRNPQHRYFVSEMAAGETMSTTVIFVIPKDEQFDTYSHFIKIDPTGVGDNTLGWVDMICLDSVIGQ